ncbi:SigE family RNA polymerase sigma factor [Actinocorallia aurantiaca]|jgi:RNA polymerase sigma-70 factor (sigma-E family)|uniref:SigE family RNA polymerase sigma factor n=1 Tax=Actinocorallia aurantiaca TaxID=46204 RepID=A0ABP6GCR2_9ACTN
MNVDTVLLGPPDESTFSELYKEHALGLTRLAFLMVGDRQAAEDVVQEAFLGLYRRWRSLRDPGKALVYARSAVLNGSRSVLRRRRFPFPGNDLPPAWSAESEVMVGEDRRQVLAALQRLPARQREALILRYFLDLSEEEAAATMRISRGTVKSTTSRGVAALGRLLEEHQ